MCGERRSSASNLQVKGRHTCKHYSLQLTKIGPYRFLGVKHDPFKHETLKCWEWACEQG